jgi:hypothetical protein
LEEAGLELLTLYGFPKATWKSLRPTNMIENFNREFRRRTKSPGGVWDRSRGTDNALRYRLVAFGQIQLRRIDGAKHLPAFLEKDWQKIA